MPRNRATIDQDRNAPFSKGAGITREISQNGQFDWGYVLRMRNVDDTADIDMLSVRSDGVVLVAGAPAGGGVAQTPWQTNIDGNGKTLTGVNTVGATFFASSGAIALTGTSPAENYVQFMQAGVLRIQVGRQGPEGGANTGSNFGVFMYDDAGALLRLPIFVTRSSGLVDLTGPIKLSTLPSTNPGGGSKQIWYDPADGNRLKYAP